MPDFLLNALMVGLAIALVSGPLGAFAVWRKMSYFGDTLAHSALIGVAFGLFADINISLAIVMACVTIAILLTVLESRHNLSTDTLLGVLSHGSLAIGLISVSLYSDARVNLYGYLFGDFLTVSHTEIIIIAAAVATILCLLCILWKPLLMLAVDEDLAFVEGRNVKRLKLVLMIMIAAIIALAMKIVGVMLITALLIIPAAASRRLVSSPEAMAVFASVLGMISVGLGLTGSYWWDIPAGPAVVLSALILFVVTSAARPGH